MTQAEFDKLRQHVAAGRGRLITLCEKCGCEKCECPAPPDAVRPSQRADGPVFLTAKAIAALNNIGKGEYVSAEDYRNLLADRDREIAWLNQQLSALRVGRQRDEEVFAALREELLNEQEKFREEYRIVDRVWKALGVETMEQAGGKTIDELVAALREKLAEARKLAEFTRSEFDRIDKETRWSESEPRWWLAFSEVDRRAAAFLAGEGEVVK